MLTLQYFHPLLEPLRAGVWVLVPLIGTLALLAGAVAGIIQRRRALLLFLVPFLVSEFYVIIAGLFHGRISSYHAWLIPSCIFPSVQIALIGYLLFRLSAPRFAPLALAVFSVSYALFAWFIGGMAFTGDSL